MIKQGVAAFILGAGLVAGCSEWTIVAEAQVRDVSETGVFVNRQQMSHDQVAALTAMVGAPINAGQYWYDHATGLYGMQGGRSLGQILPGMTAILQPVAPDASGGNTRVFINGRAIHPSELAELKQMYGIVPDGRYMMNGFGQVAPEGGQFAAQAPGYPPAAGQGSVYGAVNSGQGVYMPELGGRSGGTHVGRASDGCIYVSAGEYSTEVCD